LQKDIQDFLQAGNEILNSVSSAIDRNDYSTLHADVARVVKSVSVDRKVNYSSQMKRGQQPAVQPRPQPKIIPFFQKKISKYLGVPQMTFSAAIGAFLLMPFLGSLFDTTMAGTIGSIVLGVMIATCVFLFIRGRKKYDLSKKYYQYGSILKDAEYFNISDLARAVIKSDKSVLKDIKDMIKSGFLPRARLDSTEQVCMVTDRAYEQYLGAESDRMAREQREKDQKKAAAEKLRAENEEYKNLPANAVEILEEGKEYIAFVRHINDVIPDTEEMSNKLYRLEEIMNKIFAQVKKDPTSADELHKLMNYYLPTTKKLLNAYVELDKQPEVGENITQTKREIDDAMDTINMAFESLLDGMFQDMAWDISSDISVMKTMMAQDGLAVEGQGIGAQTQGMAGQAQGMTAQAGQTLEFGGTQAQTQPK
jgi:5-bromo-4-chloroindolyl phosphate hydrolysis protein